MDHVDWLAYECGPNAVAGVWDNDQGAPGCGSGLVPGQMNNLARNDEGPAPMPAQTNGMYPVSQRGKVPIPGVKGQQQIMVQQPAKVVCYNVSDIPPGRQPAKILQCGICFSGKLFNGAYEIKRHMATHSQGQFACDEPGCDCVGTSAFTRKDKLVKHMREAHPGL
ncbi:hypothetical protein LTR78_000465 [Recurvomyces mirabilis]|uniref:C2H2-type domain-containing protein n=1 Tax=Recurvomyces mirabilis TaxID=574656 RepID=A0AAE1C6M5_9PEZI|nr:hypothetical protein LTR78_000465 [Recurvomyces mirabilis]KAK5162120.1 hypothetical protein LTS14_000466 [Recurvomyces mirabilis]